MHGVFVYYPIKSLFTIFFIIKFEAQLLSNVKKLTSHFVCLFYVLEYLTCLITMNWRKLKTERTNSKGDLRISD